eukprot:6319394-Prymnesium_polylepis.2
MVETCIKDSDVVFVVRCGVELRSDCHDSIPLHLRDITEHVRQGGQTVRRTRCGIAANALRCGIANALRGSRLHCVRTTDDECHRQ